METSTADTSQSLNVEESRAKRLERQHARLRDRGGIFRPTNRNNNLFDVLVQATHRRSPCRSRSVSPQKKTKIASNRTQVLSSSKNPALKHNPAFDVISETDKDESAMQKNQTKKPKGKQKQGPEVEVGNGSTESRLQSNKIMPEHKKDIAPRRRTKSSTNDECSEHKPPPKKTQKPKPKGRRKKTDVDEVAKDSPPKEQPVGTAKCKSATQTLFVDAEKQNSYKSQSHVATAFLRDEVHKEKPIIDRSRKKAKVNVLRDPDGEPVIPTKPKSQKRKVESEALDVDDLPPRKRKVPSKPRSANVGVQNLEMENDTPVELVPMSEALANAINGAQLLVHKESSGHTRKKATPEVPHSDRRENIDPRPRIASKAKRKRPKVPAEGADEPQIEMVAKKPKTTAPVKPRKDVPQPIAPTPPENRTSPHKTNLAKNLAKNDSGLQALNPIISKKKRKENAAVGRPIKTTSTSKNITQSKGRPRIPLHVKKKLDVQYIASPSDDEPDPIDFLS